MRDFQSRRCIWLFMGLSSLFLVLVAHNFFQLYLYMPPCEQCVYIRFAFFCMFVGGVIAAINPKKWFFRIFGYAFGFWGSLQGVMYSYKLYLINKAIKEGDPFGLEGCSQNPSYPLSLPLDKWFSSLFLPTGDCGYDNPVVPDGVTLSKIQEYFINLYSDGWYLFPASHSINMAQCTLVVFGISFLILAVMLVKGFFTKSN